MTREENVNTVDEMAKAVNEKLTTGARPRAEMKKSGHAPYRGPFSLMRHFAEEMENMFTDFGFDSRFPALEFFEMDNPWFETKGFKGDFWPPVEISETDGMFIVRADLPGLEKDEINVEIRGNRMIIEGERKREFDEDEEGFFRSERSFGTFYRSLPLPETVNAEVAKATFINGVLEVKLAAPAIAPTTKRLEINEAPKTKVATTGT